MVEQARDEAPLECCGLLAGRIAASVGRVEVRYPLVNAAASPTEFISEPRSMFDAVRDMNRRGLELLAVYHSHPTSLAIPSRTDLERSFSPDVINIIISLQTQPPSIRAWWLESNGYEETEMVVE